MRRHQLQASQFFVGLRSNSGWLGGKQWLAEPTQNSQVIMALCYQVIKRDWQGEGIFQVQVTAMNPTDLKQQQLSLFDNSNDSRDRVNQVKDHINERFGEFSLMPGRLLKRSEMPNVISPAWKPTGHRKTI